MMPGRLNRTPEEISALLAEGQGERIAFAVPGASPARLAEHLIALANAHGGTLLMGVQQNGKLVGVADPQEARASIQAAGLLSTPPLILPLPQIVELDGRAVCLVEVPPGLPHVYSLNGRYLTRSGGHNRLLSASELTGLLLERGEAGFESRVAPGATLDDLDNTQVAAYL
ncbi:MAG: putative DNA binding domain-containing protein, partial [Anaerolineae bacterium]|nr:putative DNA binding domain-containing protein [Anaerolineae bacterium]